MPVLAFFSITSIMVAARPPCRDRNPGQRDFAFLYGHCCLNIFNAFVCSTFQQFLTGFRRLFRACKALSPDSISLEFMWNRSADNASRRGPCTKQSRDVSWNSSGRNASLGAANLHTARGTSLHANISHGNVYRMLCFVLPGRRLFSTASFCPTATIGAMAQSCMSSKQTKTKRFAGETKADGFSAAKSWYVVNSIIDEDNSWITVECRLCRCNSDLAKLLDVVNIQTPRS